MADATVDRFDALLARTQQTRRDTADIVKQTEHARSTFRKTLAAALRVSELDLAQMIDGRKLEPGTQ